MIVELDLGARIDLGVGNAVSPVDNGFGTDASTKAMKATPTTMRTPSAITRPETLARGFLIGCHAAPFQQCLPSCDTHAAPSKRGGLPSGPTL